MIEGVYRLTAYTVDGVDSSSNLNPIMDSIEYDFRPNNCSCIEDPAFLAITAHPLADICVNWLFDEWGEDTFRISPIFDCTGSWQGPSLRIGPFATRVGFIILLTHIDKNNMTLRGVDLGKTYEYTLKRKS